MSFSLNIEKSVNFELNLKQQNLINKLSQELNSEIKYKLDAKNCTPLYLDGKLSLPTANRKLEEISLSFLEKNKTLLRIKYPNNEFNLISQIKDDLEKTHLKYNQVINNIPIFGSQVIIHFNKDNSIYYMNGRYYPTIDISTIPSLTEKQAIDIAIKDFNKEVEKTNAKLVIFPYENKFYLCYQVNVVGKSILENWDYFVDAQTGKIIHKVTNVRTNGPVKGSGTLLNGQVVELNTYKDINEYFLIDTSKPMFQPPLTLQLKGVIVTFDMNNSDKEIDVKIVVDLDNNFNDTDVIKMGGTAHYNLGKSYDYFQNVHNWKSFDNKGSSIKVYYRFKDANNNAFSSGDSIVFGNVDNITFSPMMGALDIVVHELTHSVHSAATNFLYENQQGAVAESLADSFACLVDEDWMVGEDVYTPNIAGDALRYIDTPTKSGLPDHMDNYKNSPNTKEGDYGGVHINSAIPSKAFYFIATSIGREKIGKIYFRAMTTYLTSTSNFLDLRNSVLKSANDLYQNDEIIKNAIVTGFDTVGIIEWNPSIESLSYWDKSTLEYLTFSSPDPISNANFYNQRFTSTKQNGKLTNVFFTFSEIKTNKDVIVLLWEYDKNTGYPKSPAKNIFTISNAKVKESIMGNLGIKIDPPILLNGDFHLGFSLDNPSVGDYLSILTDDGIKDKYNESRSYFYENNRWWTIKEFSQIYWSQIRNCNFLITAKIDYSTSIEKEFIKTKSYLQNYPNPFNPECYIAIEAVSGQISAVSKIKIYNILGQVVRELNVNNGSNSVYWDGRDNFGKELSSGMYFYETIVNNQVQNCRKMLMLK